MSWFEDCGEWDVAGYLEEQEEAPSKVLTLLQDVAPGQIDSQPCHETSIRQVLEGAEKFGAQAPLTPAHHIPPILQACLQKQQGAVDLILL